MNGFIDGCSWSTPYDMYDDQEEKTQEEFFDEESADEERFGILTEIYGE